MNSPNDIDAARVDRLVSTALRIAERTVRQWDDHDRFRMTDEDRLFFEGEIEPGGVTMARAVVAMASAVRETITDMPPDWLPDEWHSITEITPDVVASRLSKIVRWNGQAPVRWSVARHSLLVVDLLADKSPDVVRYALLHDAHEIWTGDIPRPVFAAVPQLREFQQKIDDHILPLLGCDPCPVTRHLVRQADDRACAMEMQLLGDIQKAPDEFLVHYLRCFDHDYADWLVAFQAVQQ